MSLADNIKTVLEFRGMTVKDLIRLSEVTQPRVSQILSGNTLNPRADTLKKLAKALSVTVGDLTDDEGILIEQGRMKTSSAIYLKGKDAEFELSGHMDIPGEDGCQVVAIYNMVSAGPGAVPEWDEPIDRRSIPANLLKKGTRAVLVKGRSMEPAIRNGAIIGVDLGDKRVVEGEVYAVLLPLHGAAVKRLYLKKDSVLVRSDNKEFPEQEYAQGEIGDNFILGRVKWVVQEL